MLKLGGVIGVHTKSYNLGYWGWLSSSSAKYRLCNYFSIIGDGKALLLLTEFEAIFGVDIII